MEYLSKNQDQTYQIASDIAQTLEGGGVLALSGELGSGKTTFTQGLAKALGVDRTVTSPTFVLMKEYKLSRKNDGIIKNLIHIDAYRIDESDIESIGLFELIENKNNLIVIEWPERIAGALPPRARWIKFEYMDENSRKITYDFIPRHNRQTNQPKAL